MYLCVWACAGVAETWSEVGSLVIGWMAGEKGRRQLSRGWLCPWSYVTVSKSSHLCVYSPCTLCAWSVFGVCVLCLLCPRHGWGVVVLDTRRDCRGVCWGCQDDDKKGTSPKRITYLPDPIYDPKEPKQRRSRRHLDKPSGRHLPTDGSTLPHAPLGPEFVKLLTYALTTNTAVPYLHTGDGVVRTSVWTTCGVVDVPAAVCFGSAVVELLRRLKTAMSTLECFATEIRHTSANAGECVDRLTVIGRSAMSLGYELQRHLEEGDAAPGKHRGKRCA